MRKLIVIAGISAVILTIAGVMALRGIPSTQSVAAGENDTISAKSAKSLQDKIDAIKNAETDPGRAPGASTVELSEAELESYMLFSMQDEIPAKMDAFDVQLEPGTVAAQTQLTFPSDATGNPIIDVVVGGTHDLFVRGALSGADGRGKFDLLEIRVDGIPVPNILIESLFDRYVKPRYPEADLKEPFDLPWGIEELKLGQGRATVAY